MTYDEVNKPEHYAGTKIEVIDYIEDKQLGFCLGNVIKYVSRAGSILQAWKTGKRRYRTLRKPDGIWKEESLN